MIKSVVFLWSVFVWFGQQEITYAYGGEDWVGLCANGTRQSPIHIHDPQPAFKSLKSLKVDYQASDIYIKSLYQGYSISGLSGILKATELGGENAKTYYGTKIYVHSPSEHKIEGELFDLEVQFFHDGSLNLDEVGVTRGAALSVLFDEKEGVHNEFLQRIIDGEGMIDINTNFERKTVKDFYAYQGSTTIPPCTENIDWFICAQIQYASANQIEFFKHKWEMDMAFAGGLGNNRRIQPSNNRTIWHHHDTAAILFYSIAVLLFTSFL